jgi:hypothetical protein
MTWKVEIDKVSSAVPMEPTQVDLLKEAQLERKRLDRAAFSLNLARR